MTSQLYQLVVRKGPRPGQIIPLEIDHLTVGRDPLSDIVIEDPEVSRHHATFSQGDEGYLLQDKGSTNGSFIDGKRLGGEPVQLNPGQVIMFGSTVTLVYQATSTVDPMATMVGPAAAISASESEPPAIDEEPIEEPEPAILPSFEAAEAVIEDPSEDLEALPSFDVPDPVSEDPFADLEQMPSFEPAVELAGDPFEDLEPVAEIKEEVEVIESTTDDLVVEADEVVAFDVPDSQAYLEEDDEAMATMIEPSPVVPDEEPVEPEPMPSFEEPEPWPTFEEPEPEAPAPSFPTYEEPEPMPEVELPAEPPPLAPLPSFQEPEPEPVIESPRVAFAQQKEAAAFDSAAPFPDLEPGSKAGKPIQASGEIVNDKAPKNKNRNIIIGVVGVVALCCLCSVVSTAVYFLAFAN